MTDDARDPLEAFRESLERANRKTGRFAASKLRATELVAMLSADQRLMLSRIVAGWSNRDMAEHQGVDVRVVESQRAQLFAKINAGSSSDAVRIGIYAGL